MPSLLTRLKDRKPRYARDLKPRIPEHGNKRKEELCMQAEDSGAAGGPKPENMTMHRP